MEMCETALFLEKSSSAKNGQKLLGFFKLFNSLVLSGNGVEWKPFSILRKLHIWEKSGSQVMTKNALGQSDFSII